jgi:hypothetical protein
MQSLKWFPNPKSLVALVSGALFAAAFQMNPLRAANVTPSGRCAEMVTTNSWGISAAPGSEREYADIGIIDFDNRTGGGVIVNTATATAQGVPSYRQGELETASVPFQIEPGPLAGTFKLAFGNDDYALIAPVNGGATYLIIDPSLGGTGICQKI